MSVHVSSVGEGEDLVLIHGWGMHGGIWQGIVDELATSFCVHCVDLPGFGHSRELDFPVQEAELVEMLNPHLPEKATYLGWSMGGNIALLLAHQYPDKVKGLITVANNVKFIADRSWPHAMKDAVLARFADSLVEDYKLTIHRFLAIQTMGSLDAKNELRTLKGLVFERGEPNPSALRSSLQFLQEADHRSQLENIKQPHLAIFGRLDGLVPVKALEHFSQLAPKSKALVMNKSSHAPFISEKDLFLQHVMDFMRANR